MSRYQTTVHVTIETDRPLDGQRVELWAAANLANSAISLHQPTAKLPGDPTAREEDWAYTRILNATAFESRPAA